MQVYLLAAGDGRRSHGPKAWKIYEGKTLLEKQVHFLLSRFSAQAVTVSIQEDWRQRCQNIHSQINWINEDPKQSPLKAFQVLLSAQPQTDWAFFYHVDMPVWNPTLFDSLAQGAKEGIDAVIPLHAQRLGHPVLLSPKLGPQIQALNPSIDRLDHYLRTRTVTTIEVPFDCVLQNWNQIA